MATLTREEMLAVLRDGKSVLHGEGTSRRIISSEDDLPSEAELASGDRDKLQAARDAVAGRVDKLTAELAAIDHELATFSGTQAAKTAKADAEAETEAAAKKTKG